MWEHIQQRAPSDPQSISFQNKRDSSGLTPQLLKLRSGERKTLGITSLRHLEKQGPERSICLSLTIEGVSLKEVEIEEKSLLADPRGNPSDDAKARTR